MAHEITQRFEHPAEHVGERNWVPKKGGREVWVVTDGERFLTHAGEIRKFYTQKSAHFAAWEARINGT